MGNQPDYELRFVSDEGGEKGYKIWCNKKGVDGKARGWDAGDGGRVYAVPDEFWTAQRRLSWLNWSYAKREAGQRLDISSPEQERARRQEEARDALEAAGRAYFAATPERTLRRTEQQKQDESEAAIVERAIRSEQEEHEQDQDQVKETETP